jgi:hypothetical protein
VQLVDWLTLISLYDAMLFANRSAGRDVHTYDVNDPTTVLGGLVVTNGVTNTNFYSTVEIIFIFSQDYSL